MDAAISKPPATLPTPQAEVVRAGISLLPPLSRKGHGPGLILVAPSTDEQLKIVDGVPSAFMKWAEEGFVVVQLDATMLDDDDDLLNVAIEALLSHEKCSSKDSVGVVAYSAEQWNKAAPGLVKASCVVAGAVYINAIDVESLESTQIPLLCHVAGDAPHPPAPSTASFTQYYYPKVKSQAFATPFHKHFDYNTDSVSHTRNLQFLKPRIGGPYFDLEKIWEEHTYYEFADRSVEHTMSTMVQEPYVNHIPTLTGGIGRQNLTAFYRHNFIFNNSADTELELISRTVGIDRVVDEFIFKFTHDRELDWLLPGVPATHRKVEAPFTAVVNIRGDRLYHEHISWDQGTVLRQLGLLPEYLPFPYAVPGSGNTEPDTSYEYRVPVAGLDVAMKMRDRNSIPSNQMFDYKPREKVE